MITFAIIMLVLILLLIHNLLNWGWRMVLENDDPDGITFMFTSSLVSLLLTVFIIIIIIKWGSKIL